MNAITWCLHRMTFVHSSSHQLYIFKLNYDLHSWYILCISIHLIENDFNLNSSLLRHCCCNLDFWFQISNSCIFNENSWKVSPSVSSLSIQWKAVTRNFRLISISCCEECKRVKINIHISMTMIKHFCHLPSSMLQLGIFHHNEITNKQYLWW